MKKILGNLLIATIFAILILLLLQTNSISISTANTAKTTEQKTIQEVANAYYNRQTYAQYCSFRKSFLYPPEEGTSQHSIYSVCSHFPYSVYYQSFGIQIPEETPIIAAYAQKYYDIDNIETNDVIEFWHKDTDEDGNTIYCDNNGNSKDIDLSTPEGRNNYVSILLNTYNLQIGDVICYRASGNKQGHALLVYDIIYDSNGNPIDAIIRESTSKFETKTTKVTIGFSYAEIENQITENIEGTFQELYLASTYQRNATDSRNPLVYNIRNSSYFTILRPLLKDENGNYTGQYYYYESETDSSATFGYNITGRTIKDYQISNASLQRIRYSSIYIEKTVDVFNNSVVSLNNSLEYCIKIKNESNADYEAFDVIENISEYVDIEDNGNGNVNGNTITWQIENLKAGDSTEIKYKVKVKNSTSLLGKKINSTGTAAGIPSATITNTIFSNLNISEKDSISSTTQGLVNSKEYNGQELLKKIYDNSLGFHLDFADLDLTNLIIVRNGTQYYPENSDIKSTIYLNTENIYSNYVLSNYYSAVYTNSSNTVYQKNYENSSPKISGRSERADTIYEGNLQTGDILVYKNTQTANDGVTYETESGTFYLIYIDNDNKITINETEFSGFIGIDENGNIKTIADDFVNLRTLLGKDFYAIFRPTMAFAKEREIAIAKIEVNTTPTKNTYIQNYENLDLAGGDIKVEYNDGTTDSISMTNENVKVTGFDNTKLGVNTLTVEYEGKTATFNVEIINIIEKSNKLVDNTIAKTKLPNAGINIIPIVIILIVTTSSIVFYKKFKELKDVK